MTLLSMIDKQQSSYLKKLDLNLVDFGPDDFESIVDTFKRFYAKVESEFLACFIENQEHNYFFCMKYNNVDKVFKTHIGNCEICDYNFDKLMRNQAALRVKRLSMDFPIISEQFECPEYEPFRNYAYFNGEF